jgi:hypothetical protein
MSRIVIVVLSNSSPQNVVTHCAYTTLHVLYSFFRAAEFPSENLIKEIGTFDWNCINCITGNLILNEVLAT